MSNDSTYYQSRPARQAYDPSAVMPTVSEPPAGGGPPEAPPYGRSGPPWYVGAVGVLLLVIVGLLIALLLRDDDGSGVQADGTTTSGATTTEPTTTDSSDTTATTTESTTTTTDSTTTTESTTTTTDSTTTTTTVDPSAYESAVWPWFQSQTRYDDPVAAATGFAEDFVGFDDPVVGPFQQGDSRSGEVEVQPRADGPVTVVFVRQLGPDDTWWVLGSATEHIEVDQPDALDEVTSPLEVSGRALAFEGTVNVELRADGSTATLVDGFVTGGGGDPEPFEGSFDFDDPGEGGGAVLLFTESAEDGTVWEAAVVRVRFPG